jgi:hypothetical protein
MSAWMYVSFCMSAWIFVVVDPASRFPGVSGVGACNGVS